MAKRIRAVLRGDDAQLGRVSATDFAHLLIAMQSVVARAAGNISRQPVKPSGRWTTTIDENTRLRLVAVKKGSVQTVLEIPDFQEDESALHLADPRLGELAVDAVMDIINETSRVQMPDVANGLANLADQLGIGVRYSEISIEDDVVRPGYDRRRRARLTPQASERLRRAATQPAPNRPDLLTGVLFEADFEQHRAHLRLPHGRSISVDFPAELSDDIHAALRNQATLQGDVRFDAASGQAVSVRLRDITRPEQLIAGSEEFWRNPTVDDLVSEQQVAPADDWDHYRGPEMPEEDVDAFLDSLEA